MSGKRTKRLRKAFQAAHGGASPAGARRKAKQMLQGGIGRSMKAFFAVGVTVTKPNEFRQWKKEWKRRHDAR